MTHAAEAPSIGVASPLGAYLHIFEPATQADRAPLLLLHRTGGSESDLVSLGRRIAPGSAILAIRGNVLEEGRPRFFQRRGKGDFDLDDLAWRVRQLDEFIAAACRRYGLPPPIAVGHSNGANLIWAMMLRGSGTLSGAVLFRPMLAFDPRPVADLDGLPILIASGRDDRIVPADRAHELAGLCRSARAKVTFEMVAAAHDLCDADEKRAASWIADNFVLRRGG